VVKGSIAQGTHPLSMLARWGPPRLSGILETETGLTIKVMKLRSGRLHSPGSCDVLVIALKNNRSTIPRPSCMIFGADHGSLGANAGNKPMGKYRHPGIDPQDARSQPASNEGKIRRSETPTIRPLPTPGVTSSFLIGGVSKKEEKSPFNHAGREVVEVIKGWTGARPSFRSVRHCGHRV